MTDPVQVGPWLLSRAAGVTAFLLASVAVVIGLTLGGRLSRRPGMARALRAVHEQAALGALIAIAVHGFTLLFDRWLAPGPAGIAIPFVMGYRPLATGLGIIAGWLAALLGLSFYARRRIGAALWRRAHRWTVLVWLLAAVHTLTAGSDACAPWMRAILAVSATLVAALFAARLAAGARRPAPAVPAPVRAMAQPTYPEERAA